MALDDPMKIAKAGTIVTALLVLLVGAGGFLYWRSLERDVEAARDRWEARLAALRAAGARLDDADFEPEPVPEDENAYGLVLRAQAIYDAAFDYDESPTFRFNDDDAWDDEDRAWLDEVWPKLEPVYEALAEAAERPVFQAPSAALDAETPHVAALWDLQILQELRVRYRPEETLQVLVEHLRLLNAWRAHTTVDALLRNSQFAVACDLLQRAFDRPDLDLDRAVLDPLLAEAESRILPGVRQGLEGLRRFLIAYVAHCAEERGVPEVQMSEEVLERCRARSHRVELYASTLAELDRVTAELDRLGTEADLRLWPHGPDARPLHPASLPLRMFPRAALETLAQLRLARWALLLREERRAARPLSDDLAAYADRFESGVPLDPYTGRPFLWERVEGGWWLEADVGSVDPQLVPSAPLEAPTDEERREALRERGLAWEIR